jgi:hypothetical protein
MTVNLIFLNLKVNMCLLTYDKSKISFFIFYFIEMETLLLEERLKNGKKKTYLFATQILLLIPWLVNVYIWSCKKSRNPG